MNGKVVEHFDERDLGGRDLDQRILINWVDKKAKEDYEFDGICQTLKLKQKALDAIEKARKALSNDEEATVQIDEMFTTKNDGEESE